MTDDKAAGDEVTGDEAAGDEAAEVRRRRAAAVLERRYRRLLAWYPAGYRAAYADDMLGVALARSAEGQRWPGSGETVNLVLSGIRQRIGAGLRNPVRRDTAAVVAITGAILLAALSAGSLLPGDWPEFQFRLPMAMTVSSVVMTAWWLLVAAAGMLRWRRLAAAGAGAGLAALVALAFAGVVWTGLTLDLQVLLAVLVAAAAFGGIRVEAAALSWRAMAAVMVAAAIVPGWPAAEDASTTVHWTGTSPLSISSPLYGAILWWGDGVLACSVIALTVATGWLRPAVRRRVMALLVPLVALTAVVCWWSDGALGEIRFRTLLLDTFGWIDLALTVIVSAAVGLACVALCKRSRSAAAIERSTS
jgi:hypothetical protein